MSPVTAVANRPDRSTVRAEFCEMPGLRLTLTQAQRLFDLSGTECREVLDALVDEGFLHRSENGVYLRADQRTRSR
jgi:predicted transcriptional regulator of viral defense system